MALYTVTTGNTINALDVNQLVNILTQPSGGQEIGTYYLNGWGSASGQNIRQWMASRSQGETPVSVSVDTSIATPNSINTPTTEKLSQYGFHVKTTTTGATSSGYAGGLFTIQY